ncbi:glycerophosphodiester phosphodiesterase family protein [Maribellus sp. YY47]|uniref:glycerophosphodiester phosphodiesterase family protein n=1 Tax=Maribellus sp. YY47 TaxID=2929486 RepID=UPI0020011969|nr:glycerophosphodiester phosphodiesterase family protein [Maribellus sp. YY47]MCK3685559.1 PKD domain-containing protein [Maribellus sp. YY47]
MKKSILLMCLWIGFGILLQSCQKDDNGGGPDIDDEEEEYELPAPVLTISNPVPCLNEEVEFSFTTDVAVSQTWSLGDQSSSSEKTVKHSYTQEGVFNIILKLSDGKGGTVRVDTTVSVMGKRMNDALADLMNNPSRKWICAHRANTYYGKKIGGIPENSVEAVQRAIEAGVEMVEVDVKTTSDGVPVIMHDELIDRTTNGAGAIAEMTLSFLKRFNLKAENGDLTTSKVPTLEEILLAGRGKVFYDLHLGAVNASDVVNLVDSLHMLDRVAFYTGSQKTFAQKFSDVNSQIILFPYVKSTSVIDYWAEDPRIKMIQLDYNASTARDIVTAAKAKDMASFGNYLYEKGELILQGDYSVLDSIVNLQFHIIQTDYAEYVNAHLGK